MANMNAVPRKRLPFTTRSLARAIKGAKLAGLDVTAVRQDGTIETKPAEPEKAPPETGEASAS